MTPLIGFTPDYDPALPGAVLECMDFVPGEFGMKGAPSAVPGGDALPAACIGAAAIQRLDGARRIYAGTQTGLYVNNAGAWDNVSRVANYSLSAGVRWSFAQYANATLAAAPGQPIQRSVDGGNFEDIVGSPECEVVADAYGFAFAFNTTDYADEWRCSGILNETDWQPSPVTQSNKGRLVGGKGAITAALRMGDDIIAYKADSVFLGRYQGGAEVWRFLNVSNDAGCVGKRAVVGTPIGHIFVGSDNIYVFDGTLPRPLDTRPIRRFFFTDMSPQWASRTELMWDRINQWVWIAYVPSGSSVLSKALVYHLPTQRWGLMTLQAEVTVHYLTQAITYDAGSPEITTYDSGPTGIPYDSAFWVAQQVIPGVIDNTHTLAAMSGSTGAAYFITNDFGADDQLSQCKGLRVRYQKAPTTSVVTGYYANESGVTQVTGPSAGKDNGSHDVRQRARWHRFRVATTGNFTVSGVAPELTSAGRR